MEQVQETEAAKEARLALYAKIEEAIALLHNPRDRCMGQIALSLAETKLEEAKYWIGKSLREIDHN